MPLKALEVVGTIDEQRRLQLDEPLPIVGPSRVRVIILIPEETGPRREGVASGCSDQPGLRFPQRP